MMFASFTCIASPLEPHPQITPASGMAIIKTLLTADDLLTDSFRLARQVFDSGFRPTHIVGVWRGGAFTRLPAAQLPAGGRK